MRYPHQRGSWYSFILPPFFSLPHIALSTQATTSATTRTGQSQVGVIIGLSSDNRVVGNGQYPTPGRVALIHLLSGMMVHRQAAAEAMTDARSFLAWQ